MAGARKLGWMHSSACIMRCRRLGEIRDGFDADSTIPGAESGRIRRYPGQNPDGFGDEACVGAVRPVDYARGRAPVAPDEEWSAW